MFIWPPRNVDTMSLYSLICTWFSLLMLEILDCEPFHGLATPPPHPHIPTGLGGDIPLPQPQEFTPVAILTTCNRAFCNSLKWKCWLTEAQRQAPYG